MENKKITIEIRKETFATGKVKYWVYFNDVCKSVSYTEEEALQKFNILVEENEPSPVIEVIKSIEI
jgi:hypothetical protein